MVLAGVSRASLGDEHGQPPRLTTVPSAAGPEASPPVAEPETPPPARLSFGAHLGLGELLFRIDHYSFWGASRPVEAWLGLALSNDFVLFGQFYDAHIFDPSSDYGEMTGLDLLGLGLGAKYYLTPAGIYLSGSVLLSRVSLDRDVEYAPWGPMPIIDTPTHWGVTGRLAVGKDAQVSRGWRLGLEGDVVFGWMGFEYVNDAETHASTVKGFSLLGSASYGYEVPSSPRASRGGGTSHGHSFAEVRAGAGHLWTRLGGVSETGASYPVGASVGWAIGRRAVLLADFECAVQPSPSIGSFQLESTTSYAAGPRLKYYLDPSRLFLSGALLVSRMEFQGDATSVNWGLGADLSFGKEWRVSDSWALGLAAEAQLVRTGTESHGQHFAERLSLLAFANFSYQRLADQITGAVVTEPSGDSVAGVPVSPAAASPGRHTHDGLYVGARLGLGSFKVEGSFDYQYVWGASTPFALSVGWAFARSLVIFGEFHQIRLRHPESSGYLTDLDFISVGPGVTYYLPGLNLFASLSASLSKLSYRNGTPTDTRYGTDRASDWGMAGRLSLGKEWWVSDNWGLGLAGEVLYGRMGGESLPWQQDVHYTAKGFALLATASFN
jgi:hypothetical protein